jgi:hypothetical protein
MFDLFRFVALRPAASTDPEEAIQAPSTSVLVTNLRGAVTHQTPRTAIRGIADAFIDGEAFVDAGAPIADADAFERFHEWLEEHAAADEVTSVASLESRVAGFFDRSSSEVVADEAFGRDRARLHDSLVAMKLATWRPAFDALDPSRDVRLIALIERIAAADAALAEPGAIGRALTRRVAMPAGLSNVARSTGSGPAEAGPNPVVKQREALVKKHALLQTTYRQLLQVESGDLEWNVSTIGPNVREDGRSATEIDRALRARAGDLISAEIERLGRPDADAEDRLQLWRQARDFVAAEDIASADGAATPLRDRRAFTETRLTLKREGVNRFSPEARTALAELNVHLDATPLPVALERISGELTRLAPGVFDELQRRAEVTLQTEVVRIGNDFVLKADLPDMPAAMQVLGGAGDPLAAPVPVLPKTHGNMKPAGVGDLLVTRQQLIGYRAGEVAHIENVLVGEAQRREVVRSETVEETTLTEEERIQHEERDVQSTDRFEMQRESQNVLVLDGRVAPGGSGSPSFGPVVEFENGDASQLHGAQTLTEKSASRFSQDVTRRAASRVTERTRTQVTRRLLRQFTETTAHSFENKEGPGNVVGVYQWIDKVYQTQVFNYGKRLFYDLVIPEPAAFLTQALAQYENEGEALIKPASLTVPLPDQTERPLQPTDINDANYGYYAAKFGAGGIKAPPDPYIVVSKIFAAATPPAPQQMELVVPDGYEPATHTSFWLEIAATANGISELEKTLDLVLSKGGSWHAQLGCRRKQSTYQQWQLTTYDAIVRAHGQRQSEYSERLAAARAAIRVGAMGQSSQQKRALERAELRKGCLTLLTQQHFDVFSGIDSPKDKAVLYPQVNLANAAVQGKYIRFFEQAFEWEQMVYHCYPYFWGRKAHWMKKALLDELDPLFADFLRAGAARALLPVRPGFEKSVINFMETGEIWGGAEPPAINDPLYLPLLEELEAQTALPAQGTPYGLPWKVTLPTTLVRLRDDGKLPKWKEVNGEWVEDA